MAQDAIWYGGRPRPKPLCVGWELRFNPQKGGGGPKFLTHVYCGQSAELIKMALGMEVGLSLGDFVLHGDPDTIHKGAEPPICSPCLLRPNGCMDRR